MRVQNALSELGDEGRLLLVEDINRRSSAAGWSWEPRPVGGYAASMAFDPSTPHWDAVEDGFARALELVHGRRPDLAEVVEAVVRSAHLL